MTEIVDYMRKQGSLPTEALLGYVLISTCVDGEYARDDIVELFEELELDTDQIPEVAGATDAFNKAVTMNKESRKYRLADGDTVSIMLRAVTSKNAQMIKRAVVRERASTSLGYGAVGDLTLYKAPRVKGKVRATGARLGYTPALEHTLPADVTKEELVKISDFVAQVRNDYERFVTSLDGRKISKMLDSYLKHLGAISLKNSVRFVPISAGPEALRLCVAISSIGECRLDNLPLVDLAGQRDLVLRAFQEDTEAALQSLTAEALKATDNAATPATYARLMGQYNDLMKRTDSYVEMLGIGAARTTTSKDVARGVLLRLNEAVAVKAGM